MVRPERFELPTFWFVGNFAIAAIKGPILILRNLIDLYCLLCLVQPTA
jgi:hypothetical protein